MLKILGLSASDRKMGNTELALKITLDAARAAGAEVKMFNLNELNLEPCNGCIKCFRDEKNECIYSDDLKKWQESLYKYDGVVIGAPCYTKFPPSILRQIVDRGFMFEIYNREVKPKPSFVFSTEALEAGVFYDNSLTLPSIIQFAELFRMPPYIKKEIKAGYMPGELLTNEENISFLKWAGAELVRIIKEKQERPLDKVDSIAINELKCPVCDSHVFRLEQINGPVAHLNADGTIKQKIKDHYQGIKYACPFCDGFILDENNQKTFYKGKFYTKDFLNDHYKSVVTRAEFERLKETVALRGPYNSAKIGIGFSKLEEI